MFSPCKQVTASCHDHFNVTLIQSNLTDSSAIQHISQATNKKEIIWIIIIYFVLTFNVYFNQFFRLHLEGFLWKVFINTLYY